jgi:hypothetical protein
MTLETQLRSAMADAVATARADTDHLVTVARRRGLGIRRRRQALSVVGVAAALAVVVSAPSLVAGGHDKDAGPTAPTGVASSPVVLDTTRTDPFSGRSTAAALLYAVNLAARGAATDFHGQGGPGELGETYAFFRFTPAGSTTSGEVGINVQPNFFGSTVKPGDAPGRRDAQCQSFMQSCTSTLLADGSRITTYDDRSDYGAKRGVRRVVELYRTDGVRLAASASNGYDITERDEKVTRDEPVLSTAELVAVVSQPWWGPRLPTYFTEQGAQLDGYVAIGGAAEPTSTPSK